MAIKNQSPKGIKLISGSLALLTYFCHKVIFCYYSESRAAALVGDKV